MKVLLATVCIGERCRREYDTIFKDTHVSYAQRFGYDHRVITEPFFGEHNPNLAYAYKWCVFSIAQEYDLVIVVDHDIAITMHAPAIHTVPLNGKMGGVNEYIQPSMEQHVAVQTKMGWETTSREYYKLAGIENDRLVDGCVLNTGVLVGDPKIFGPRFRKLFTDSRENLISNRRGPPHTEQSTLGCYLMVNDLIEWIPSQWNTIWFYHKTATGESLNTLFKNAYFVHFAGRTDIHLARAAILGDRAEHLKHLDQNPI